ncbi:MAG: class I adenylate-forming enzyme family protein [Pseudoxanthomonas sp.]
MDSLCSRLSAVARDSPQRVAIIDGERKTTYGELWGQIESFACHLKDCGLRPGERVAVALPNRIEAAVACYATWRAGGIAVPLNVQARARDFLPWLQHSGASHLVHEAGHHDIELALDEARLALGRTVVSEGHSLCATCGAQSVTTAATAAGPAPALILYTSGTTGAPKGVVLSHDNLLANVLAVATYLDLGSDDRVLSVLPFYYAYGASVLHTHLISGACLILAPNLLFPQLVLDTAIREHATSLSGVPSTYALLLDHLAASGHDLSGLNCIAQAGGAMSATLTHRLRAAFPAARLFVMYGQTEATSRISWLHPEDLERKLGSVGTPVHGLEWKIVREDGKRAAAGEDGDVWVRGPSVMLGYWNNPAATASVLQEGWLHTGDMGHLDEDGFLFLHGRRGDMIKTGAHRVHPNDVEEVISQIPGITEVAVIGIDDEIMGQVIKAFVVANEQPPRAEDRIKAHCRQRLAPYKIPRHIAFVDALPRTASGKVRRFQLTAQEPTP